MRWLFGIIFKLFGWAVEGDLPDIKKFVLIVAPHTSNWDFIVGVLARGILNKPISYLGKKSLFKPPFGWFFRWLGGQPVDRKASKNMVDTVAEIFNSKEQFILALAPEGTRSQVNQWRTGFYHMAVQANVPIVGVAFDYASRRVRVFKPFFPSGSLDRDLPTIQAPFKQVRGKNF